MSTYRVFYFENHCFTDTEEFGASGDVEASIIAGRRAGNRDFELWRGGERLKPSALAVMPESTN